MNDHRPADGARVLADLNALRALGAQNRRAPADLLRTASTFAAMAGAEPLEAGLAGEIDGIGNVLGTSAKAGRIVAGFAPESQTLAGWLDGRQVIYALEAARVINLDPGINGAVEVMVR